MQSRTTIRVAVLTAAVATAGASAITGASGSAGTPDVGDPSDSIRHVSPEEAAETDLRLVAEAKGWTLEEARHDRETADQLGDLQEVLIAEHGDAYAGGYLSDEPTSPPTLRFVGAVSVKAQEAIDASDLEPNIETKAKFTLAQLRESTIQAIETLAARGFEEAIAGVDERAGRVYLTVRDRHNRETAHSIRQALPDAVRPVVSTVEVRGGSIIQPAHTRGGNWMADDGTNECTSGWSVRRLSDGVEGVALAAHCEGINEFRDATGLYSAPWRGEHIGDWGELEWHTTSHIELAEFWADSSHLRDTLQIEGAGNISVGESVCIYGRASNNRNCNADVEDAWISITFEWEGAVGVRSPRTGWCAWTAAPAFNSVTAAVAGRSTTEPTVSTSARWMTTVTRRGAVPTTWMKHSVSRS